MGQIKNIKLHIVTDIKVLKQKIHSLIMAETTLDAGLQGVNDMLRNGPPNILKDLVSSHPLESSEKIYHFNEEKREMASARNIQGLHMPFKLGMEKAIVSKIRRLPGLPSSNIAMRTLLGVGDEIGPEDIFNDISDKYIQPSMQI